MTLLRTILVAGALLSTTSVAQIGFKSWPVRQAPAELHPAISHADLVIVEMQGAVLHELSDAIARRGPTGGFGFCHLDATAIIQRIGGKGGTVAGVVRAIVCAIRQMHPGRGRRRLSRRTRDSVRRRVEGFVVDLGDRIGVLRPIAEQAMCASCHGAPEQLAPGVDLVRRQRYPADRAVGFRDGEIRGWFWVEIAKRP